MDRILSGDEQSKYHSDIWQLHDTEGLLKAQLAKTDKEWSQWAFEICVDESHSSGYWTAGGAVMIHQHKCECDECWKERKKELGVS